MDVGCFSCALADRRSQPRTPADAAPQRAGWLRLGSDGEGRQAGRQGRCSACEPRTRRPNTRLRSTSNAPAALGPASGGGAARRGPWFDIATASTKNLQAAGRAAATTTYAVDDRRGHHAGPPGRMPPGGGRLVIAGTGTPRRSFECLAWPVAGASHRPFCALRECPVQPAAILRGARCGSGRRVTASPAGCQSPSILLPRHQTPRCRTDFFLSALLSSFFFCLRDECSRLVRLHARAALAATARVQCQHISPPRSIRRMAAPTGRREGEENGGWEMGNGRPRTRTRCHGLAAALSVAGQTDTGWL